ncbi:MAG: hypothetical protein ACW986_15640 [Promethearchaeota archaeon]|jgi:hypothetical protein
MSTEALKPKFYKKEDLIHLPKTEIYNKTYWYAWLLISVLITIAGFVLLQFLYIDEMTSTLVGLSIIFGALVISPLFIGYFKKKTCRRFFIDNTNPSSNQLLYTCQMRKVKTSSKIFQLDNIQRFEVIQRKKGNKLKWYCSLLFKSGKYMILTTALDEPLAFHYAKQLNEFLALNTSLDKNALDKALMPYIPLKEQKRIKIIRTLQIILFFVVSGIVILFAILFAIGNVELLPSIIIMFLGLFLGILLIMALNGATFDSM